MTKQELINELLQEINETEDVLRVNEIEEHERIIAETELEMLTRFKNKLTVLS